MHCSNFSSKNLLFNTLSSYWYLSLISMLVLFLGGPFPFWWSLHTKSSYIYEVDILGKLFKIENITMFYALVYAMATVIGLVIFTSLSHKKQMDFYNSQHISRKKIFFCSYFSCFILGAIPLVLMFLLGSALEFHFVGVEKLYYYLPVNVFKLLVFCGLSLSFSTLAVQLSSSAAMALYITIFLNLFAPLTVLTGIKLLETLVSTIKFSYSFVSYLSPLTHFLYSGPTSKLSVSSTIIYFILAIALVLLSYRLYKKHSLEVSGNHLELYKPINLFIQCVSIFLFAGTLTLIVNSMVYKFRCHVYVHNFCCVCIYLFTLHSSSVAQKL